MSFTPVQYVEHKQAVTTTTFNNIKTGIDAIYSILGTSAINNSALGNYSFGPNETDNVGSILVFLHTSRYLLYEGDGVIVDPSGVGDNVTISDPDKTGEVGEYDLESVNWLGYGMQYQVSGVEWAIEYDKDGYIL